MIKSKLTPILLIASLVLPVLGSAQSHPPEHTARQLLLAKQELIGSGEAVAIAQRQYGGKVLSVDLIKKGKSPVYRIKLLTDEGRVKTVHINAVARRSGRN